MMTKKYCILLLSFLAISATQAQESNPLTYVRHNIKNRGDWNISFHKINLLFSSEFNKKFMRQLPVQIKAYFFNFLTDSIEYLQVKSHGDKDLTKYFDRKGAIQIEDIYAQVFNIFTLVTRAQAELNKDETLKLLKQINILQSKIIKAKKDLQAARFFRNTTDKEEARQILISLFDVADVYLYRTLKTLHKVKKEKKKENVESKIAPAVVSTADIILEKPQPASGHPFGVSDLQNAATKLKTRVKSTKPQRNWKAINKEDLSIELDKLRNTEKEILKELTPIALNLLTATPDKASKLESQKKRLERQLDILKADVAAIEDILDIRVVEEDILDDEWSV